MRRAAVVGVALAFSLLATNCASISNLSTARPLGAGNSKLTIGVSKITTKSDTIPIIQKIPEFFFFELIGSGGITERFDLSLKYTFPAAASIEGKYCFIMNNPSTGFFLSPALRAGYTAFPTSSDDSTSNDRIEIAVPVYASIFFNENFGFTLAPVYSARFFMEGSSLENLAGGMASFCIGKNIGIILEGDYLYNFAWKWHEIQGGVAFFIPIKGLFSSLKL